MRTALVATALVLASLPVHADDLLSTGTELPGSQGAAVPSATGGVSGLPTDQIVRLVEQQGYSDVTGLGAEGDMLKASAVNKLGSPVDLLIDPSSGKVLQSLLK
ncbi:MAG TPA: PepSY domain-containing protein [Methylomirabilota bacterium]|nr:PepSY domain-containing protein [Methylomirabilota bacterium]